MISLVRFTGTSFAEMWLGTELDGEWERGREMEKTYLCVPRVGVKYVGEELGRACHAGNDEAMDVIAIHHEAVGEFL